MMQVTHIPAFTDNYHWLLSMDNDSRAYVVDPGDHNPVIDLIESRGLQLEAILITHRHWDHVDGIEHLLSRYQNGDHTIPVYGPDSPQIPQITHKLYEGDTLQLFDQVDVAVWETPGHTQEHIVYISDNNGADPLIFSGDTLFAAGCGRLLGGNADQHCESLQRIATLPENTQLYCAHEYTLANLDFAQAVEPDNQRLMERIETETQKRKKNIPTIPSTIAIERQTNPFIRINEPQVIKAVKNHSGIELQSDKEVFAALRRWKDVF